MAAGGPPEDIPADRLFRLLISRPRPTWPLTWRFSFALDVPLHVRAMRGLEEESAVDAADGVEPSEARESAIRLGLVAASLWTPNGPAFASAKDVGSLSVTEADGLMAEALYALRVVSPTYARSDTIAWSRRLRAGAEAGSNIAEAFLLGGCFDSGFGFEPARPDRYFGMPLADLTDGQLLAYRAARDVVGDARKRKS